MDLHKASDYDVKPTVEEIKHNHIADLEVQHKYGVKFIQYWINEDAGLVFCLMEGPDKESCAAVHREAHGAMPCNIIELQGGDYLAFIHDDTKANEFDIVEKADGTLDAGYRIILVADYLSISQDTSFQETIEKLSIECNGRIMNRPGHRKTIVFSTGYQAIECAAGIMRNVQAFAGNLNELRIGISAGEPVTEQQGFFADAIQLANRLCDIAQNGQVLISSLAKQLTGEIKPNRWNETPLKTLHADDEHFLNLLIESVNKLSCGPALHVDGLSKHLGMSRSRLYRRITQLAGCSANDLIHELRMQKALKLIKNKYGNITQIAIESGFNNPSYFAQNFQKRFGVLPFKAAKLIP
jgi:AraC-like DNA-binding protein